MKSYINIVYPTKLPTQKLQLKISHVVYPVGEGRKGDEEKYYSLTQQEKFELIGESILKHKENQKFK